jgi:hypothetical protein
LIFKFFFKKCEILRNISKNEEEFTAGKIDIETKNVSIASMREQITEKEEEIRLCKIENKKKQGKFCFFFRQGELFYDLRICFD